MTEFGGKSGARIDHIDCESLGRNADDGFVFVRSIGVEYAVERCCSLGKWKRTEIGKGEALVDLKRRASVSPKCRPPCSGIGRTSARLKDRSQESGCVVAPLKGADEVSGGPVIANVLGEKLNKLT